MRVHTKAYSVFKNGFLLATVILRWVLMKQVYMAGNCEHCFLARMLQIFMSVSLLLMNASCVSHFLGKSVHRCFPPIVCVCDLHRP